MTSVSRIARLALTVGLTLGVRSGGATAANPAGCGAAPAAEGGHALDVAGVERRFLLRLPAVGDPHELRAVVFAFHGFGGTAALFRTQADFARAWPEAIVVYPDGMNRTFPTLFPGVAALGWQVAPGELGDRDLAFFDALRAWILAHTCADPARLFATGHSNGGFFANVLGCARAGVLRAIAPAAGGLLCDPDEPVAAIIDHGLADRLVSFAQGADAAERWSRADGCEAGPITRAPGCHSARSCSRKAVVLCAFEGGHEYDARFPDEAVEFFRSRPKEE